jgi:hypothetical protein
MGINEIYPIVADVQDMFRSPYDTVVQKYFDGKHSHDGLENRFPEIPIQMLKKDFIQQYMNDPQFLMHKALEENTITHWKPDNPIQLCHCKGDEIVFYENATVALEGMKTSGGKDVILRNPGKKYGHRGCAIFATAYSKFYFDSFLEDHKHGRKGSLIQRFLIRLAKLKKPIES